MPIPTYDELLRPLLDLAANQDITRQSAAEAMTKAFQLLLQEAAQRLPSGQSTISAIELAGR